MSHIPLFTPSEFAEKVSDQNALRQTRRDNKKSIVRNDDGSITTSVVYTAPAFAKRIIEYFSPQFNLGETFLDPCRGLGAFYNNLPEKKEWCEIQEGRDFLDYHSKTDWTFCNLPWRGRVYSELAAHAFDLSDNVVSLVKLSTAIGTNKRFRDAKNAKMNMKEIIFCDWEDAAFSYPDGTVKGPEGFILAIIHYKKNWDQGTVWNSWCKKDISQKEKPLIESDKFCTKNK